MIQKVWKFLAMLFVPGYSTEIWERRNRVEKFFFLIEFPSIFLIGGMFLIVFRNFNYGIVVLAAVSFWLISRIISYGSSYTFFSKHKAWPLVSSNIFFDLLFIVIIFDIAYTNGLFNTIKEAILVPPKDKSPDFNTIKLFFICGLSYLFIFIVTTKVRHSFLKLFPDIKKFWNYKNLGNTLVTFILLSLYIVLFFAFLYYMVYILSVFRGFSESHANFLDFAFYSFNVLYSSPVSSFKPTSSITKLITGVESIFAYLLLVAFIAFLLDKHSEQKQQSKRMFLIGKRNRRISIFRKKNYRKR